MRIVFLFLLLFSSYANATQTVEILRTDGSKLRFYVELPKLPSFPVSFLIHGSVCSSAFPMFSAMAPVLANSGIAVVTLEKYGIDASTTSCPREYIENNTVHGRINDHLLVAAYLRSHVAGWNKKLIWAGGSEGGQISALGAPLTPETAMVVMLASGGGLTMSEELPIAFDRLMRRQGSTEEQIQLQKNEIESHYLAIKTNPTPDKEWLSDGDKARNTYKYWDSILWIKALPTLESLEVPMLLIHGTEDTSCPVESADILASRFTALGKTNLTYKRYDGLEHNWKDLKGRTHGSEVMSDALSWIIQNVPK